MRLRSTFSRLFLDNLLVMVLILAMAGWLTYRRLDTNYQAKAQADQDRFARLAAEHFRQLWPLEPARVDRICKELFDDPAIRLTVIATDGAVLGDSESDPRTMANHRTPDRPEILAALEGQAGADTRTSETLGRKYRYVARPLMHDDQVMAVVRLAVPVRTIAEGETFLRNVVLYSALIGVVTAVLLGLLASWIWYAPLRRITRAAQQLASGDLSPRALGGKGRLADLAGALNELRDNLGTSLAQVASKHEDFQTVLANLREGVIATDADNKVVLMNASAGRLLGLEAGQATGKHLQSVLPVLEVMDFYEQAVSGAGPHQGQFEIDTPYGRRNIEVHVAAVPDSPSSIHVLLVLRDVTDLAGAATMKAQFVANASHELRTPLATLRAAVDSLGSVDPADRRELEKLTAVLDRHVARLEEMTNDLLDLHRVESTRFPLHLENVAVGEFAEWVRGQFVSSAVEKGINLSISASPGDSRIRTDRKLLELILRNLVDNAVKFTPAGGRVTCEMNASGAGLGIRVRDTGCGIAVQDLPRVFERFYQGDAARDGANQHRGTGLGLAIVKHAAERLGAKVDLTSEPGRGTEVTVVIPQDGS